MRTPPIKARTELAGASALSSREELGGKVMNGDSLAEGRPDQRHRIGGA
jgi:hypothetical protein